MTLPAAAARAPACSCRWISAARAQAAASGRCRQTNGRTDGRTDGRTPDRYIDSAQHIMRAASVITVRTVTATATASFALRPLPKTERASQNNRQSSHFRPFSGVCIVIRRWRTVLPMSSIRGSSAFDGAFSGIVRAPHRVVLQSSCGITCHLMWFCRHLLA